MPSTADLDPQRGRGRPAIVRMLRERLVAAEGLIADVRHGLDSADEGAIEDATARLRTIVEEYGVLAQEFCRLGTPEPGDADAGETTAALRELEDVATRVARSSAFVGGVLERMVTFSRGLLEAFGAGRGGTYLSSGRTAVNESGLRLREQA